MRTARELYDARQRLGLRVADVARKTRVPIEQIVAIESGEPEVMPAPELLKKLLPALAAALGLDGSSVTRRYLVELHFLTAPELAKRVEPDDQTVIQPSQAEVHAVASETVEELALTTDPARTVAPDLPLHAGMPDRPAAHRPQSRETVARRAGHRGLATLVSGGFVAGLLLSAAFFRGAQPPRLAWQSARTSDAPPRITDPDQQEAPADAVLPAPTAATPPAVVPSKNETPSGRAPADQRGSTGAQPATAGKQAAARQSVPVPDRSTEPLDRTARTGAHPNDTADLSGDWLVTNRIDSTSYRAFQNLRIGYRLRLTQHGNRIVGEGRKWVEGGQPLPRSRRTPIKVEGTLGGRWLELHFVESGAKRASAGAFVMLVADDGTLQGSFTSDAANSSGSAVATRETDDAR